MSVFISYTTTDSDFVEVLLLIWSLSGAKTKCAINAMTGGEETSGWVHENIAGCDLFVVVLSPAAVESEWVRAEVALAFELGKTVVPLMLERCDASRCHVKLAGRNSVYLPDKIDSLSEWLHKWQRATEATQVKSEELCETVVDHPSDLNDAPPPTDDLVKHPQPLKSYQRVLAAFAISLSVIYAPNSDDISYREIAAQLPLPTATTQPLNSERAKLASEVTLGEVLSWKLDNEGGSHDVSDPQSGSTPVDVTSADGVTGSIVVSGEAWSLETGEPAQRVVAYAYHNLIDVPSDILDIPAEASEGNVVHGHYNFMLDGIKVGADEYYVVIWPLRIYPNENPPRANVLGRQLIRVVNDVPDPPSMP